MGEKNDAHNTLNTNALCAMCSRLAQLTSIGSFRWLFACEKYITCIGIGVFVMLSVISYPHIQTVLLRGKRKRERKKRSQYIGQLNIVRIIRIKFKCNVIVTITEFARRESSKRSKHMNNGQTYTHTHTYI